MTVPRRWEAGRELTSLLAATGPAVTVLINVGLIAGSSPTWHEIWVCRHWKEIRAPGPSVAGIRGWVSGIVTWKRRGMGCLEGKPGKGWQTDRGTRRERLSGAEIWGRGRATAREPVRRNAWPRSWVCMLLPRAS